MAEQEEQQQQNQQNAILSSTLLFQSRDVIAEIKDMNIRCGFDTSAQVDSTDPESEDFNYNSMTGLIVLSINGYRDIQEQAVQVEYLTQDKMLLIPYGLGMNPYDNERTEAPYRAEMATRFRKLMGCTFEQVRTIIDSGATIAAKRTAFDARPLAGENVVTPPWLEANYYLYANGEEVDVVYSDFVFAVLSRILSLNYDIRDTGLLTTDKDRFRVTDEYWKYAFGHPLTRLTSKLHAYTLECIALLNYAAVNRWPLGAWTRAYGISCGILPHPESKITKEYKWVRKMPIREPLTNLVALQKEIPTQLMTLCLNILAMFGLFHLAKNHTFKTDDQNMMRICKSFVGALRTIPPDNIMKDMFEKLELTCRTISHPFGLAQTYWLAILLEAKNAMAAPLGLRVEITPPPVQRLFIVDAAAKEWQSVPVGEVLNSLFKKHLETIRYAIADIKAEPPRYSELFGLYGYDSIARVPADAMAMANAMMPLVSGYASAMHVGDGNVKDGLACAMSFENTKRDSKIATQTYSNLWSHYVDNVDSGTLEEFVKSSMTFAGLAKNQ